MIAWIGTIASVVGSFAIAFQIFIWGYLLFMIGSISWLLVALIKRDKPLGILNLFFLTANIIGLYNAI
jgi:hypothetical protein